MTLFKMFWLFVELMLLGVITSVICKYVAKVDWVMTTVVTMLAFIMIWLALT